MHLLICVFRALADIWWQTDDRQLNSKSSTSTKRKHKRLEAWQRAIKSKEKFKEEVEDKFFLGIDFRSKCF